MEIMGPPHHLPATISGRLRTFSLRRFVQACTYAALGLWLGGCGQNTLTRDLLSGKALSYRGKYFAVERPEVVTVNTFERADEKSTSAFRDSKSRKDTLTQEMKIKTKGWIYHPALAIYSVNFRPKVKGQTLKNSDANKQESDLTFFGYGVDATILQYKPYTLTLSSNRNQSQFSNSLSSDSVTESALDRASLFLKYEPVPTTVSFERRSSQTDAFFDTEESTMVARVKSNHRTDQSDSFAEVEANQQKRTIQSISSKVNRIRFSSGNTYKFSNDVRLLSSLVANTSSSESTKSTNLSLAENLELRHRKNLSSQYSVNLQRQTSENSFTNSAIGSAGLTHKLYENLTTEVDTKVRTDNFSNGNIQSYDARLNLAYQRRIPWGRIGAFNGYGYSITDNKTRPVSTTVVDASHVLTATNTSFLANDNVEVGSFVVTDATGLVIYVENVDYVVRVSGASTGIERTLLGGIGDGDTVLVDYDFTPNLPNAIGTSSIRFGVNLFLWDSLDLFYNISHSEENLLSGTAPSTLADDTIQRAGAKIKWKWTESSVEYEQRDTTRAPLSRFTLREAVSFRPLRRLSVTGSVSYSQTQFKDTADQNTGGGQSTGINGVTEVRWQPLRWADIRVRGIEERIRGDTQEIDREGVTALLNWWYGLWNGSVKLEYLREDDLLNNQSRDQTSIFLTITRKLWE